MEKLIKLGIWHVYRMEDHYTKSIIFLYTSHPAIKNFKSAILAREYMNISTTIITVFPLGIRLEQTLAFKASTFCFQPHSLTISYYFAPP